MAEAFPTLLQPEFLQRLERLRLAAKRLASSGQKGEHPSARKGFSLEFSDYRKYQGGDDLRYVDWNIYRRLDRLWLKLFEAEEEINVYLLLDISRSMAEGEPSKIEFAKSAAAALGYIGLRNLDRLGGLAFSTRPVSYLELGRGKRQILKLFRFLADLTCEGQTDLRAAAASFSSLFPRPGLVVLLSDLFDPRGCLKGLAELVQKKHQLLVIHLLDPRELRPELWGEVSLLDVESDREKKLFLDHDLVRSFNAVAESYLQEIESFCFRREIDYLRATTTAPFEDFVLLSLRKARSIR